MAKPEKIIRAGAVRASIWKNTSKNGQDEYYSIVLERRYKDGDEWKSTNRYGANDLPKAQLVLAKSFEYVVMPKAGDEEGAEEQIVEEEEVRSF